MLSRLELEAIKERASDATPGPWFAAATDDDMCMSALYVTTEPTTFDHSNTHGMAPGDSDSNPEKVVCITLLQSPPLAIHKAQRWDEDTLFIAHAREDVPALVQTVEELRANNEELQSLPGLLELKIEKLTFLLKMIAENPGFLSMPIPELKNKTARTLILNDKVDELLNLVHKMGEGQS